MTIAGVSTTNQAGRQRHRDAGGSQPRHGLGVDRAHEHRNRRQPECHERNVCFERIAINDEHWGYEEQQRGQKGLLGEPARQGQRGRGGDQGKNDVCRVERNFTDVPEYREHTAEDPLVQRRMRVAAHVDVVAHKHKLRVIGVKRIDLGLLRSI